MSKLWSLARGKASCLLAIGIIVALYFVVRVPELSAEEFERLADRFAFTPVAVSPTESSSGRNRRTVNPAFEPFAHWISAVGAAAAIGDLDGDRIANDLCLVDPRTDRVTVGPVPGTGERYERFEISTRELDAAKAVAPMGCIPSDMNEDGQVDVLVYYWGRPPIAFLRRPASSLALGGEAFLPRDIAPPGERWYTNAATFADLDGDGHADLVVGNYFPDGARILDPTATEPDEMQHSMSRAFNGGVNRILRFERALAGEDPDVVYAPIEKPFPTEEERAWTLAVGAADLDGDLLPELYFANDFGPDRLYHNRSIAGAIRLERVEGTRRLTTPRSRVLGRDSFKGMGVDFADINGDGRLDFFVSNIADEYALLESHFLFVSTGDRASMGQGEAGYVDRGDELGVARSSWGWDTRFGDFDNDGVAEMLQATGFLRGTVDRWPELQELATANDELLADPRLWPRFGPEADLSGHARNVFYVRGADGRYHDVAEVVGMREEFPSRGVATADVDRDGDLDVVIANQWAPSYLYRNELVTEHAFLGLNVLHSVGAESASAGAGTEAGASRRTRAAIGAVVRVFAAGRTLVDQVDGGNGHSGVSSPELHFGLGHAPHDQPVRVEVDYIAPSSGARRSVVLNLEPGWHEIVLPGATEPIAVVEVDR